MSDDIVTRLRESVKNIWDDYNAATGKWAMEDAADEIERLRELLQKLAACIDENSHAYGCLGYKFDGWCTCEVEETLKAVRGE